MTPEKELIDGIKKIERLKKYQTKFISTLENMLQEDKIVEVTKAQLTNLKGLENTAV